MIYQKNIKSVPYLLVKNRAWTAICNIAIWFISSPWNGLSLKLIGGIINYKCPLALLFSFQAPKLPQKSLSTCSTCAIIAHITITWVIFA